MKVADLLEARRSNWRALEQLCQQMEKRSARRIGGEQITRFASLYRAVCADLALAESYQLPPNTVDYLHQLVGRAHNQLYRSRWFKMRMWTHELLFAVPRRLYRDPFVRIAMVLFWGLFGLTMFLGSDHSNFPGFAQRMFGSVEILDELEHSFQQAPTGADLDDGGFGMGFYTSHNTTIGLRVFAWGLLLGVGGLYETAFNAATLGVMFGHMTTVPQGENFYQFVTAHGPFELTAIILAAAAGMRLGFSMVATGGLSRLASLERAGREAMPSIAAAMILFVLAALIEANISPSSLPYEAKAAVATISSGVLMVYFVMLGGSGE